MMLFYILITRYNVHGAGSLVQMTIHKVVAMIWSSLLHKILWLLALNQDTDWAGLLHLVKFYKSRRLDANIGLPKPNDFHDISEYLSITCCFKEVAIKCFCHSSCYCYGQSCRQEKSKGGCGVCFTTFEVQ